MRLIFKDQKQKVKLEGLINSRGMKALFDFIQETIINGQKSKAIPYSVAEGASPHLMSLVEAIRVERNDAVHPQNAKVSDLSVRLSYQAFPHALEKFEELRESSLRIRILSKPRVGRYRVNWEESWTF